MHSILIVDDEQDIRDLISVVVGKRSCKTVHACDGAEALVMLKTEAFDLIILDVMMPEMDGWEVCRRVKSSRETKHIPVLLLTVRNQPLDKVIGREVVHADEYVTKPFDNEDLLAALDRLLPVSPAAPATS